MHGRVPEDAPPPPQAAGAVYFEMDTGEDDGSAPAAARPAPLMEVLPQVEVWSGTMASRMSWSRLSMLLCCRRWNSCRTSCFFFRALSPDPEQVIAVPKILPHDVPTRRFCREPQLVEQLAEVPTVLYFLKQRIPKQIVDTPVPFGVGGVSGGLQDFLPGHVEQTVDFPAPCSGVRRLQGFLPEQSSAVTSSSSSERISERNVEQIAVSRGFGDGLQDFLPGQSSSSSSHDPARIVGITRILRSSVFSLACL